MNRTHVLVEVTEVGADMCRIDELERHLLRDLRARDLITERQGSPAPSGAKSGIAITAGALVVAIANSPVAVNLVTGIFEWLGRSRTRGVKLSHGEISIELSSASPEEQRRLIAWLEERIQARPDHSR